VVLTSLSKHKTKDFQIITAFGHSTFMSYYITIDICSYEYDAEKMLSLSNIQQMSAIHQ